jgi:hypothetical protein
LDRGRLRCHVLAGGAVGQVAPVGHGPHDVALGDDPGQAVAIQDDQRADVLVLQPGGGLFEAVVGRPGDPAGTVVVVHDAGEGPGHVQGHRGHLALV